MDKVHASSAHQIAQVYAFRTRPTKRSSGWTELLTNVIQSDVHENRPLKSLHSVPSCAAMLKNLDLVW